MDYDSRRRLPQTRYMVMEGAIVARQIETDGFVVAGFARIQPERSEFLRIQLPVKRDLTRSRSSGKYRGIGDRWKGVSD